MEQNESLRQTLHQIAPTILKNVHECELREWGRERESAQIFTNAFGVISEQQMYIRHKKLQHLIFFPNVSKDPIVHVLLYLTKKIYTKQLLAIWFIENRYKLLFVVK